MAALPSGTVTFLFTDVEGSTRLLEELGADAFAAEIEEHRQVIRNAVAVHHGVEVDAQGDSFFVAFARASDAAAAATAARDRLTGRVRVRMGMHTGEPLVTPERYIGMDVHRAARIASAAHGGQILLSQSTRDLLDGLELRDLGEHRLKDLTRPERIWQLGSGEFPPVKSLNRTNLPLAGSPLIGREAEVAEIALRVRAGCRLVTLTGTGGVGKTRLALQAAAELAGDFADGVWFVPLAPLRDSRDVPGAVAQALEVSADESLVAQLVGKRLLLVLDNAEHLPGVEFAVRDLLVGGVVALVTSRSPLHLSSELEQTVEPLPSDSAVAMFVERARAAGRGVAPDEIVGELCKRLDNLPLAVELAAARTKLLSPHALLQRLDHALPLLGGGPRDAPERQQTLRATIEWSHDLLDEAERCAFRRLSVFRGSACSLEDADAIAGTEFETIASLVDKSLLKPIGDARVLMLETLREYAREELDRAGETAEYSLRHAQHYLGRLREIDPILRGPRTSEFIAWFLQEEDNLRAALEWLLERDVPAAAEAAVLLCPYWTFVGRLREGADRMARVAEQGALPRVLRAKVLFRLADLTGRLGEAADAEAPARDAAVIAEEEGDVRTASQALVELAWSASHRGHHALAVEHAERALALASTAEDEWAVARATAATGTFLLNVGRLDDAETMMSSAREAFRRLGDSANEAIELSNLGNVSFSRGDYVQALERFSTAVGIMRDLGHLGSFGNVGLAVGYALLALGRVPEARDAFAEALDDANTVGATREIVLAVGATAFVAAAPSDGARLRGAANALARRHDIMIGPFDAAFDAARESELVSVLGPRRFDEDAAAGALLTLDDAVALARSVTGRNLD